MKQVFVIHGGNAFETYDEYLLSLKNRNVSLETLKFKDWKRNLSEALGTEYEVIAPQMPNSQNARYLEWEIWFKKFIPLLSDNVIFVGHSLGGIFIAKYLSENKYPKKIAATFLVAAPHNTETEHPLVDFVLSIRLDQFEEQGGEIFLYHSKDDQIVPFSNCLSYQKDLPNAKIRVFEDRGHFAQEGFPELVSDIKNFRV